MTKADPPYEGEPDLLLTSIMSERERDIIKALFPDDGRFTDAVENLYSETQKVLLGKTRRGRLKSRGPTLTSLKSYPQGRRDQTRVWGM